MLKKILSNVTSFRSLCYFKTALKTMNGDSNLNNPANMVKLNENDFTEVVDGCVTVLKRGGVIAIPTDTIYGIAALASNQEAVERLASIKHRDINKPIAVAVGDERSLYKLCDIQDGKQKTIIGNLLPGPYTLCLSKKDHLLPFLNGGSNLVGVRIPDHKFILTLLKTLQEPIALTSANTSGQLSSTVVSQFSDLWNEIDLIVDGGVTSKNNLGSTVLNLTSSPCQIIRVGDGSGKAIQILKEVSLI